MSRVDTAWLHMDSEANRMMIVGVWLLRPAVSLHAVRERIAHKLLQYPRFAQRVVLDEAGAAWVTDAALDIHLHVLPLVLPSKPTSGAAQTEHAALQAVCGELASTPLNPARPLWQFHLVEHFDGGSALVVRIHHCIGDGIALTSVMMSITDGGTGPPQPRQPPDDNDYDDDGDSYTALAAALIGPLTMLATHARGWLSDVAAFAAMADDSPTRLKGKASGRKVVAWGEPLALDEVKAVAKLLGATVNDVLLACAAGALGAYLAALGDDTAGVEIRAMVPVNLRPTGDANDAAKLGNHFGLAPLVLPLGLHNPIARVAAVHARMAGLKGSVQPLLASALLAVTGSVNKPLQDAVLGLFASKSTAVMTNVPGPAQPLKFCGATLRQTMFWVPASGDVGVGISVLSYAGGVQFALITDSALCPDPDAIVHHFTSQFNQLLTLTLMLPWGAEQAS